MNRGPSSDVKPGATSDATGPSVLSLSLVGTGTRIALIVLSLANGLVLARVLGPRGLGQLFVFMQLVALLSVFAEGGLSHSAAALAGSTPDARRYTHGLVLRIVPLFAFATLILAAPVLGLLGYLVLPNFPTELIWIALASVPFAVYANVWMSMMAGLGRIIAASWVFLAGTVVWVGLTILFVAFLGVGVRGAAVVYGVYLLVQAVMMVAVAVRLLGFPSRSPPAPGTAKTFVLFAGRSYPGAIAYILWIRMPTFLLNGFQGPASVGIFSAAQQLVDRALLPIDAIQAATLRDMSNLSRSASTTAINRYVRFAWWGMACVVAGGIALADPIVHLLLGQAYDDAVDACRVLLLGVAFSACALLLDAYFLNQLRRPGLLSILAGFQVVLVTGLGVLLIPALGVLGAAASLVLTQVIGTLAYVWCHLRLSTSRPRDLLVLTRGDIQAFRRELHLIFSRRRLL